jgi:hypothetical protein
VTDPLFDVDRPAGETEPEKLSAGRRLTQRQRITIRTGLHPLSNVSAGQLPLHREASRDPDVDGGRRCGNCAHHQRATNRGTASYYPKCHYPDPSNPDYYPRVTSGAASDCRAWWPGCRDHQWKEAPE